jgi:hypothetical protein
MASWLPLRRFLLAMLLADRPEPEAICPLASQLLCLAIH